MDYFVYPRIEAAQAGRFSYGAYPLTLWILYQVFATDPRREIAFIDEAINDFSPDRLTDRDTLFLSINFSNLERARALIAAATHCGTQVILGGPAVELVRGVYPRLAIPDSMLIHAVHGGWTRVISHLANRFQLDSPPLQWSQTADAQSQRGPKSLIAHYSDLFRRSGLFEFDGQFTNLHARLGCEFRSRTGGCGFCSRHREPTQCLRPADMVQIARRLSNNYGVRLIWETSDTFFDHPADLDALLAAGIEEVASEWMVFSRLDTITPETAHQLKRCNVRYAIIGVESGSDRILQIAGKRLTVAQIRAAIAMLKDQEIEIIPCFTIGHPTETVEEAQQTMALAMEINDKQPCPGISCSAIMPIPGSAYYARYFKHSEFDLRDSPLAQLQAEYFSRATSIPSQVVHFLSTSIENIASTPVGIWSGFRNTHSII